MTGLTAPVIYYSGTTLKCGATFGIPATTATGQTNNRGKTIAAHPLSYLD